MTELTYAVWSTKEEGLQQSVSHANLDRVQSGEYDPDASLFDRVWNLIAGSGDVLWDAISGKDSEAWKEIWDAIKQGAEIAALFGGSTAVAADTAVSTIQQLIEGTVQSQVDSDIINTADLWMQQINDAAGLNPEEVRMEDMFSDALADLKAQSPEKVNKIPNNPATIGHIFRDAEGHIPDTPQNRALLEDVANSEQDFLGYDKYGNAWYTRQLPDGTFAWVEARNGNIFEGGINKTQKTWNPETGLKKP